MASIAGIEGCSETETYCTGLMTRGFHGQYVEELPHGPESEAKFLFQNHFKCSRGIPFDIPAIPASNFNREHYRLSGHLFDTLAQRFRGHTVASHVTPLTIGNQLCFVG